jgi:hypothetical protein
MRLSSLHHPRALLFLQTCPHESLMVHFDWLLTVKPKRFCPIKKMLSVSPHDNDKMMQTKQVLPILFSKSLV